MMINSFYSVPLYMNQVGDPERFNLIQNEFRTVYETLTDNNKFAKREDWSSNSHSLSDPYFNSNLLNEYQTTQFKEFLTESIEEYLYEIEYPLVDLKYEITNSWMTLTKKGEFAHTHEHGGTGISGVYYYQTTGADGNIYFDSPNKLMTCSEVFRYFGGGDRVHAPPRMGTLLLFPSWLSHGVLANPEDSDRVSVSFNITINRESRKEKTDDDN